MPELLATLFAAIWVGALLTANPVGGFLHVFLVAALVCACARPKRGEGISRSARSSS